MSIRANGLPTLLAACLVLAACGRNDPQRLASGAVAPIPSAAPGTLADDELTARTESPTDLPAVPAAEADTLQIEILSETGYRDDQNRYVIDLLERDYAYLALQVQTLRGHPVAGVETRFELDGTSRLSLLAETPTGVLTNDSGIVEFGVVGGEKGVDTLRISIPGAETTLLLNIISLESLGFAPIASIEGALRWEDLMRAQLRYREDALDATFPTQIAAHDGQTVKLAGFMMPLDPEARQRHFLITSNPPSCFFHVPGGPAGAVEVFSETGVETTWDPIVLEGRFETLPRSETGVIYRLSAARAIDP